mgnify:CR=1 FL=1
MLGGGQAPVTARGGLKEMHRSLGRTVALFLLGITALAACDSRSPPPAQEEVQIGVLLVANGSKSSAWVQMIKTLAQEVREPVLAKPGVKAVRLAFIEETSPSIASEMKAFDAEGIDELVLLDVSATIESRGARLDTVRRTAAHLSIPFTVGGGIRTEDDARAIFDAGADKISLNSAALADPELIGRLAARYGSQAVVVAIDAKRDGDRFAVFTRSGSTETPLDAPGWAGSAVAHGAGEILLTSIDRDGTRSGFDCELTAAVSDAVNIPVIASGGAGGFEHFAEVFTSGHADAALAASIFHFNEKSVSQLKQFLKRSGVPVRI